MITINSQPDFLEPAYQNSIPFVLTSNLFATNNFRYWFDFYSGDMFSVVNTFQSSLSTYPRTSGNVVFSPHYILKDLVYNNVNPFIESFIQATSSLSYYKIGFGEQFNPGKTFSDTIYSSGFVGLSFSIAPGFQVNDLITIDKDDKSVNAYYDGTASVTGLTNSNKLIITDIPWGASTINESGDIINLLRRGVATSSVNCVYNGVRQYDEVDEDFGLIYQMDGFFSVNDKFLTSYVGAKPIWYSSTQLGEWETLSFILSTASNADFNGLALRVNTYDSSINLLNTLSIPMNSSFQNGTCRYDVGVGTLNLATYSIITPNTDSYCVHLERINNILTNGDFSTGSFWSIATFSNATSFISGGLLQFEMVDEFTGTGSATITQTGVFTTQSVWNVIFNITNNLDTDIYFGDENNLYIAATGNSGVISLTFSNTGSNFIIEMVGIDPIGFGSQITSVVVGEPTLFSENRCYEIKEWCREYDLVRLAFVNKLGGVDYWTFNLVSKYKSKIKREMIDRVLPYNYKVGDRGMEVVSQDITEEWEVNTDYLSDDQALFIRELVESPDVYMIVGDQKLPVIITDSEYQFKSTLNDQLIQYTVKFMKAYEIVSNI